jgi:hypothetical protein
MPSTLDAVSLLPFLMLPEQNIITPGMQWIKRWIILSGVSNVGKDRKSALSGKM